MNSKWSYLKLLVASAGASLFITNCTVTTSDGGTGGTASGTCTPGSKVTGCTCSGNVIGSQTCQQDGTFAACVCASSGEGGSGGTTTTTNTGGSSSAGTAGTTTTTTGGTSGAAGNGNGYAGEGIGEAGAGGTAACDSGIDPTDCYMCLSALCTKQWAACTAETEKTATGDSYCISSNSDGSGQIERVFDCITGERAKGLVKRDVVRACGATIGDSPDPQYFLWAPEEMTQATTDLMNCMADAPTTPAAMAGAWAHPPNVTDDPEDPNPIPLKPWDDCTCAKISCTSKL